MTGPVGWSYSGDPTGSPLDEVRFLIQDTDPDLPLILDDEIAYLLATWLPIHGSALYVAAVACDVISRKFATVLPVSADGVSVGTGDLSQRYKDLAVQLRSEHAASMVLGSPDNENLLVDSHFDSSIAPLAFSMGINDNPEAGQQDMGGWGRSPYNREDWVSP